MSIELLYTSAPKGLKQGSRGFCTVLSTARIPINVASRLESLSGYRQLYPPDHPMAGQNPIAYSHYRIVVAGKTSSVLSRVTAYGSDYTGRTNKIAHHVMPDEHEQVAAGPAWVMMQPTVMRTSWSGQCETPDRGPAIPSLELQSGHCSVWKNVAGDAGWGGVVAEILQQTHRPPTWLIYRADQQSLILPLINEAIALLPADKRWQATFNTYATNVPPDVDCKLRCALEGTEEARFASVKSNVIDMTKPMSLPSENELTQQARGIAPKPIDLPPPETITDTDPVDEQRREPKSAFTEIDLSEEPDASPSRPWNSANSRSADMQQPPPINPPALPFTPKRAKRNYWTPVLAVLFLAAVGAGTWIILEQIAPVRRNESVSVPVDTTSESDEDLSASSSPGDDEPSVEQSDSDGMPANNPVDDPASNQIEPRPITVVLRYAPRQLIDAVQALESGEKAIGKQLLASGSVAAQLTKMPSAAGWREKPGALLGVEQITLPDSDVSISSRQVKARRVDDMPSFSGAKLLSFIGDPSLDLFFAIAIDPSRKQSVFSGQVNAFTRMAETIHDLREQADAIENKKEFLPAATRNRVTRFIERIPGNETDLIRSLMPLDDTPTVWRRASDLLSEIDLLSSNGGPPTWNSTQRAALLAINKSLDEIAKSHEIFRISLETLQKGQRLHVPDMYFYDADQELAAALDIRLVVSW